MSPLLRVVLTTDAHLVPWVKVSVVMVLVVPPRVTEVLPMDTPLFPKISVLLLQEMENWPQEMAYLVPSRESFPLLKEVLLDE